MSEGNDGDAEQQALYPRVTPDEWQRVRADEPRNTHVTLGLLLLNERREVLEELGRLRGDVQALQDEVRRGNLSG